jgi:curved DNA-binding protein CbpA
VALGIEVHADADAIKMAYRTKAKRLHPDFNPSPIAAKLFHRLHEAYEILSYPEARKTYDLHWKTTKKTSSKKSTEHSSEKNNTKAHAAASAKNNKPKSANQEKSKTKPKTEPETSTTTTPDQPAIYKRGRVTAQPRYITFDLVWGRFTRIQHRNISGVFCRNCADRTAIRASLISWLAGWWAWPNGPKETVKALLSNMRGGQKPAERNAKLLMRQSRAF